MEDWVGVVEPLMDKGGSRGRDGWWTRVVMGGCMVVDCSFG